MLAKAKLIFLNNFGFFFFSKEFFASRNINKMPYRSEGATKKICTTLNIY